MKLENNNACLFGKIHIYKYIFYFMNTTVLALILTRWLYNGKWKKKKFILLFLRKNIDSSSSLNYATTVLLAGDIL